RLHAVGILELVDQDGTEAAGVALAHGGVRRQDDARLADQIVEGEDAVLALAGSEGVGDRGDQGGEALVFRLGAEEGGRLAERPGGFGRLLRLPRRRRPEPGAVASGAAEPGEEVRDQADGAPARPAGEPRAQHELTRRRVAGAEAREQGDLHRALDVAPALV